MLAIPQKTSIETPKAFASFILTSISIQKPKQDTIVRQSIDLYNDYQVEKFVRKVAERLEIGTSVARRTFQELTKELESYRFLVLSKHEQESKPYTKELTALEEKEAIEFLKQKDLLKKTNELIIEVLLRKSDTLTGACRNHLERLKAYLTKNDQTIFTNTKIRRNLRIKESTLCWYHKQLLAENYIQRVKVKSKSYYFEIVDLGEYTNLKEQINKALKDCIDRIKGTK